MKAACKWQRRYGNLAAFVLISGSLFAGGFLTGGCVLLEAPDPEPTPTAPPTPRPGVFVPEDYQGKEAVPPPDRLNAPGDAAKPEYFELVSVESDPAERAIILSLRAVEITKVGDKDVPQYGAPSLMRLAGIKAPVAGQAGGAEVFKTVRDWTLGQKLDVDRDKRYPYDLKDRQRVQVFFKGRSGETKDQSLLLNRMLVRSGFAMVDIFDPTTFDNKGWLNDEQYARKQINPLTKLPGLGLWAWNPSPMVVLGQRLPSPKPSPNPTIAAAMAQQAAAARPGGMKVNTTAIRNTAPATRAAPATKTAPAAKAAPAAKQGTVSVVIKNAGARKIEVIKVVREVVPSLGLKEAKDLVETPSATVKKNVTRAEAERIKAKLQAAGATVQII